MSKQLDQNESAGAARQEHGSLRVCCRRIRQSLLGKRGPETDEVLIFPSEAQLVPDSSHGTAASAHSSGENMTEASDFIHRTEQKKPRLLITDGATDSIKKRWGKPVAAIFIHAGAGYHSTANEEHHLKACSEAARESMKILRGGHSAVEAVEAAIRVLENKEITNAGYGSNLAIDGTVECDATMVDHLGRSGACGAVPNIKNPISLARLILESSYKPLSLRRVPPNLLVGEGARDFATDVGIEPVANEDLISRNAHDRFTRWKEDLNRAGRDVPTTQANRGETSAQYGQDVRKDHTNAILAGTWNEGQPDSPGGASPKSTPRSFKSHLTAASAASTLALPKPAPERSPLSFLGASLSSKRQRFLPTRSDEDVENHMGDLTAPRPNHQKGPTPDPPAPHDRACDERDAVDSESTETRTQKRLMGWRRRESDGDNITDTVGAIAIDQQGRIAAGSSSGGIGMKHRGRIGPAALVGVGTAVIPADAKDPEGITVAAVTSGTGEHMATTMASQRCAERLYQGSVRGYGGRDMAEDDENAILESFIANDFLGHPGVKESTSTGAIGAMAVKKAPGGYYLYFAHNTESFALASMGSNDLGPSCVMSRINEGGHAIAQGARKIRT
ncbi:nucleophile aminohydrolase [Xylaria sp. CBS 124048]|nr:nucleophile aminohydrolase [Xylaria sp. CBS 124048]